MSDERRRATEPGPVAVPGTGPAVPSSSLQAFASGGGNVAMGQVASGARRAAAARRPAVSTLPCETSRALARAVLARNGQQTEPPGVGEPFVPDPRPAHPPYHLEPLDPAASPEEIQVKQGQKLYAAVMAEAAARAYGPGHPLHRDLVYHYVYGDGAPFALEAERMKEVIAPAGPNTWLNFFQSPFNGITAKMKELEGRLPQTSDAEENREVSAEVSDQAQVGCDGDKPSLGMFTVMVTGSLTARRKGTDSAEVEFEFTGTMRWFDVWDFDPRLKATAEQLATAEGKLPISTRTKTAEEDTQTAHDFLPGRGFNVDTPDVPVTQKTGEKPQW
jgi:hypothetical protein